ncbi:MAG: hypothetical protein ACLP9S_13785 [Syntrophales bacterium]
MQKIIKHTAPRSMIITGDTSPCECSESVTCAYCVQANLLSMRKKYQAEDDVVKSFISYVHKNGVRPTAREMDIEEKSLRRWIQSGNVPAMIIAKFKEIHAA